MGAKDSTRAKSKNRRTRLSKERRKSEILAAAEEVFSARGFEAATISEVAANASTVEGNVYRYFDTKRALLAEVIANWYRATLDELTQETAKMSSPQMRLEFLIRYHVRALKENPGLLGLVIRDVRTHQDTYEEIIGDLNREYAGLLGQALRDGVTQGLLREDIPIALVRDMIFGGLEHYTWKHLSSRETSAIDVEAVTRHLVSVVLEGFAIDGKTRRIEKQKNLALEHLATAKEIISNI